MTRRIKTDRVEYVLPAWLALDLMGKKPVKAPALQEMAQAFRLRMTEEYGPFRAVWRSHAFPSPRHDAKGIVPEPAPGRVIAVIEVAFVLD